MYRKNQIKASQLKVNEGYKGETLEEKVRRILNNKEPIKDGAPIIYTDRKDGVQPSYNIRTDRFEVAVDAMDIVTKSHQAKRENKAKVIDMKPEDKIGGPESTQGTDGENQQVK